MTWLQGLLYFYGVANIAGGIIGFTRGSMLSLVVGVSFGLLVLILTSQTRTKPAMAYRALGVAVLGLIGFWVYRMTAVSAEGKSIMVPLMNFLFSLGVFGAMAYSHFAAIKARNRTES